jgi:hypothetical protein
MGLGTCEAAILLPDKKIGWDRFMHRKLESLPVLKTIMGSKIELVQTDCSILSSSFSDIPCLNPSIICASIPLALLLVTGFGIGV